VQDHPKNGEKGDGYARIFGFENLKGVAGIPQAEEDNHQKEKLKSLIKGAKGKLNFRGSGCRWLRFFFAHPANKDEKS
jgi:hypothetical protein